MLTAKDRRELKREINKEDPKIYIGKNGLTENLLSEVSDLLDKYEVIKIKLQKSIQDDKEEIIEELIEKLDAEYVMDIGGVFAIYREAPEEE